MQVVLHEYAVALMHKEGKSSGKLYVTQCNLCYSGSLFGKDTRAVYAIADIVSLEPSDTPTPNSIVVTSLSTEERFLFVYGRAHALAAISELMALTRGDHSLAAPRELPQLSSALAAPRFLP